MNIEIKPAELYRDEVIELLAALKLPTVDLPGLLNNFFVAIDNNAITGVVGLEIYGNYGLLRSLAVNSGLNNKGIGAALLKRIETLATEQGLGAIYLLTETAKDYFEHKGYEHIARMDIPEEVKAASEFTHVCPDTAVAMQKSL
ncbi:MAG: arsenic resistance N-acetyltransferase ArsN2 [Mucilaginibacter sp.]|jgi:amino-acid N-acetyltransferase|uniref:arsenic resistance N-acetyltransferase ArsN2 n=1 Tax=Mucilaginibacter sp. TaxID=1882438 RepID=UPI0035661D68